MGLPDCTCPVFIFRHPWRRRWPSVPSGEHNYCRYCGTPLAKDVSSSQVKLIELFNYIEHFFLRLEIYTSITPTSSMMDIIIEIMAEVLTILAIATKDAKRGRLSKSRFAIVDLHVI
ncbi:hypothetical protein DFH94DRAFT_704310 [Russula ochroleuca]|uniref:Uncharacterized protein n=1 Tax=Russula ochroleuca TaxID=152965 RepID=A0A9P5N6A3_9AGAM|nr:hypothetical protein DFH94DRAFT_704310 [Russula ochroleuca]